MPCPARSWLEDTCAGTELVVSGGGASPTALPGTNPTRFQAADLGFLYVHIRDRTLTAQLIDASGAASYERTLSK